MSVFPDVGDGARGDDANLGTSLWADSPSGLLRRRTATTTTTTMLGLLSALSLCLAIAQAGSAGVQRPWSKDKHRVPVTLGVMSRCPDALFCETVFDDVRKRAAEKINLSFAYLATFNASDAEFGVTCPHGRDECAGNVQQLCVAKHAPMEKWWEFVRCQNYQGRDVIGRSDVALSCARIAKIDWEGEGSGVGRCAGPDGSGTGDEGIQLLRDSIRVVESLGIRKSCTIVINGERVCVRDGGVWKQCENGHEVRDFIHQIEAAYDKLNG